MVYSGVLYCVRPGGKVRAISRRDLARGAIARDPARSRQIPWFRVRLRETIERGDYARSRVHIINARISHLGSKAPRQVLNTKHPWLPSSFSRTPAGEPCLLHQGAPGARRSIVRRRGSPRTLARYSWIGSSSSSSSSSSLGSLHVC